MKKIQINHRVEIENKVLGFIYLVLQITEFEEKNSKEIIEVRCYNLDTGNEVSRHTKEYNLYPTAKKELKKIVDCILPC